MSTKKPSAAEVNQSLARMTEEMAARWDEPVLSGVSQFPTAFEPEQSDHLVAYGTGQMAYVPAIQPEQPHLVVHPANGRFVEMTLEDLRASMLLIRSQAGHWRREDDWTPTGPVWDAHAMGGAEPKKAPKKEPLPPAEPFTRIINLPK